MNETTFFSPSLSLSLPLSFFLLSHSLPSHRRLVFFFFLFVVMSHHPRRPIDRLIVPSPGPAWPGRRRAWHTPRRTLQGSVAACTSRVSLASSSYCGLYFFLVASLTFVCAFSLAFPFLSLSFSFFFFLSFSFFLSFFFLLTYFLSFFMLQSHHGPDTGHGGCGGGIAEPALRSAGDHLCLRQVRCPKRKRKKKETKRT